jgi:hypothetical protein
VLDALRASEACRTIGAVQKQGGLAMPYLGTLVQAQPYTLEVTTLSKVALTVINVRRDRISEVELLTFDSSNTTAQSRTIPNNVGRILFVANAGVNGTGIVKINQGAQIFDVILAPDADISFDVA